MGSRLFLGKIEGIWWLGEDESFKTKFEVYSFRDSENEWWMDKADRNSADLLGK